MFTDTAPFRLVADHRRSHAHSLDADRLVDRVLSISFVAALAETDRNTN